MEFSKFINSAYIKYILIILASFHFLYIYSNTMIHENVARKLTASFKNQTLLEISSTLNISTPAPIPFTHTEDSSNKLQTVSDKQSEVEFEKITESVNLAQVRKNSESFLIAKIPTDIKPTGKSIFTPTNTAAVKIAPADYTENETNKLSTTLEIPLNPTAIPIKSDSIKEINTEFLPTLKHIKQPAPRNSENFTPILLFWNTRHRYMPFSLQIKSMAGQCKLPCVYTTDISLVEESHAVFFHTWNRDLNTTKIGLANQTEIHVPTGIPEIRHNSQFYIFFVSEAPSRNYVNLEVYRNFFNWTLSYRRDSDFPMPDGKLVSEENLTYVPDPALAKRPKLVSWMVSNCGSTPSNRNRLVQNILKLVPVTIYGKCGNRKCKLSRLECYKILAETHKFYLAFENSYCREYVTEKFFFALEANMVPVVYGNVDYEQEFPPGSFINVESFPTPKELVEYLLYLDQNDEEYMKYFNWKKYYSLIARRLYPEAFCAVCERVHREYSFKTSTVDIVDWYFGSKREVCPIPKFGKSSFSQLIAIRH